MEKLIRIGVDTSKSAAMRCGVRCGCGALHRAADGDVREANVVAFS